MRAPVMLFLLRQQIRSHACITHTQLGVGFRRFEMSGSVGGITKTGNAHARRALVEGAWAYRMKARIGRHKVDRIEALPKVVRDIAWREEADKLLVTMALHAAAMTLPSSTSRAANSVVVPCRLYWVIVPRDPSSSAGRAECGRAPGFAPFRRPRGRWHGQADRHKARPRRAACR